MEMIRLMMIIAMATAPVISWSSLSYVISTVFAESDEFGMRSIVKPVVCFLVSARFAGSFLLQIKFHVSLFYESAFSHQL